MRAFLDTNVLLDTVIERKNPLFCQNADAILQAGKNGVVDLYMSVLSIPIIAYVIKNVTVDVKKAKISNLTSIVKVLPSLPEHVNEMFECPLNDIEDTLQLLSAKIGNCDVIVTRDVEDFALSEIPAISPEDFLGRILE